MTVCYLPLNLVVAEYMVFQLNDWSMRKGRNQAESLILPRFYKVPLSAFVLSQVNNKQCFWWMRWNNINTWLLIYNKNYLKSNFNDFFCGIHDQNIPTNQIFQKNIYECMKKIFVWCTYTLPHMSLKTACRL